MGTLTPTAPPMMAPITPLRSRFITFFSTPELSVGLRYRSHSPYKIRGIRNVKKISSGIGKEIFIANCVTHIFMIARGVVGSGSSASVL